MTREEAIEVYKGLINTRIKEAFEFFAPELKASNEDTIKNAISYAIYQSTHTDGTLIDGVSTDEAIEWLEKQGEQKTVTLNDFQTAFEKKAKQYEIHLPNRGYDIHALCEELYNLLANARKSEQKPTAWSEEDINMFGSILSTLGICANNPQIPADVRSIHKKEESWFNELYHRVQPKQEWSEEDEKKIDGLISIVEEWYNNQSEEEKEYYGDCGYINWLKSLKPQSQWKPSDKQIDALKRAIAKERENPDTKQFARHLESLFNELMRL